MNKVEVDAATIWFNNSTVDFWQGKQFVYLTFEEIKKVSEAIYKNEGKPGYWDLDISMMGYKPEDKDICFLDAMQCVTILYTHPTDVDNIRIPSDILFLIQSEIDAGHYEDEDSCDLCLLNNT